MINYVSENYLSLLLFIINLKKNNKCNFFLFFLKHYVHSPRQVRLHLGQRVQPHRPDVMALRRHLPGRAAVGRQVRPHHVPRHSAHADGHYSGLDRCGRWCFDCGELYDSQEPRARARVGRVSLFFQWGFFGLEIIKLKRKNTCC